MSLLYTEIHEQSTALNRLLKNENDHIQEIVAIICKRNPPFVVVAARGSSDNAARYG